jgi:glutamate-1-semialdehyde 2,1-aminomutase
MDEFAPLGGVYQAGTLSGNPLAMAAGLATLKAAGRPGFYGDLAASLDILLKGWRVLFRQAGIPAQVDGQGSMFGIFFNDRPVTDLKSAKEGDAARFNQWFHALLEEGVYTAPSPYEAGFISSAHTERVLRGTLRASERCLERLVKDGASGKA